MDTAMYYQEDTQIDGHNILRTIAYRVHFRTGYLARLADSYSHSEYVIINLGFFTVLQHYFKICWCTQLYEIYVIL